MPLSDADFRQEFEDCTLPKESFHHREHIRLASIYVREYGCPEAQRLTAAAIRRYAEHLGAKTKYHETITRAWVQLVAHAVANCGKSASFPELIGAFPSLLSKSTLDEYYSSAVLNSDAARESWVRPDLKPLPGC